MIGSLHPSAVFLQHPLDCLAEVMTEEVEGQSGGAVPGSKGQLAPGRDESHPRYLP